MATNNLIFGLVLVTGLILTSCDKEELQPEIQETIQNESINEDFNQKDGMIELGEKINDPFAIHNMRTAKSNLKSAGNDLPEEDIEPNKVYLRFLPKSEAEWQILKTDTNIVLYDFPLDYDIEVYGTYFHDPEIPDSSITWQYTVIPVDYQIPNVAHEILYEVYIPPMDSISEESGLKSSKKNYYEDLLIESLKITGNYIEEETTLKSTNGLFKPKRWHPSGTIQVYDHIVDRNIPLQGAEVHARWSTHIETRITDSDGKFRMGGFIFKVNYAIKWERGYYDIRNGNFLQAWYNRSGRHSGEWDLNIGTGGESIMYATMHRAAHKHFYGDNLGIRRPILIDGSKTKICYIDKYGTGVFWGDWSTGGILPDIKIWGKNSSGNYRNTNVIFGYTAHELGHQSHSQYMGNIQFWQTAKVIYESWAQAVEWALTNDEYHKLGNLYNNTNAQNYNHEEGMQTWRKSQSDWEYSPIFVDLIDNFNQRNSGWHWGQSGRIWHDGSPNYPNDRITGYTLSYINSNILRNSYGLSSLRDAVKNHKLTGVTDADFDDLFALYW
jgi:hypothetical protein